MCNFMGFMITGTFKVNNKGVGLRHRVKREVKRLSHKGTEVKSEDVQI